MSKLQLLSGIDESLPDKNKALSFVFDCKQEYGFKKGLDWQNPHISATFAALMILKQL
jgi:prenyltransferase beta subunit